MRFVAPHIYNGFDSMAYEWTIASFVLAIVGGLLVLLLFLNKENKNKYEGNLKKLYEFLNFDFLTLDFVLKFLYTATTIFIVLNSFVYISESFLGFILYLIFGLLVTRVIYEIFMLLIKICNNTTEINRALNKSLSDEDSKKKK